MLSGHSFNALLKTLEEPPPHVKFLLATTDPQRLPVTVLSRCLQFNLKHLSAEQIEAQLKSIVASENLDADPASLTLVSRSAAGSMRDALSLLDQAIAFTAGKLDENSVREMLGTIDQGTINAILQALVDQDAAALIGAVTAVAERSMDFAAVLEELLMHLHRVAMAQVDAKLVESYYEDEREQAKRFADLFSKEDVQLFYQIGIKGRQDINLAPNPRMGLEMVLLRMHTFRLAEGEGAGTPQSTPSSQPATKAGNKAVPSEDKPLPQVTEADGVYKPTARAQSASYQAADDWTGIIAGLKIGGLLQQLADNAVMNVHEDNRIELTLDEKYAQLHNREREAELQSALQDYFNNADLRLVMQVGAPAQETPAATRKRISDEKQTAAEKSIADDPNVKALQDSFNAEINSGSVRPRS